MNQKQKLEHYRKKAQQYADYSEQLESRVKTCTDKLRDISSGLVPAHLADSWGHDTKTKYSAASTLKELADKPVNKPTGYLHP